MALLTAGLELWGFESHLHGGRVLESYLAQAKGHAAGIWEEVVIKQKWTDAS